MNVPAVLRFGVAVGALLVAWPAPSAAQTSSTAPEIPAAPAQDGHAGHHEPAPPAETAAAHDHAAPDDRTSPAQEAGLPPVTEADRAAAFPEVGAHSLLDHAVNSFVLIDQLEWQAAEAGGSASWDNSGWVGYDRDRLWFRSEGDVEDGRVEEAWVDVLYGRAFARWWDVVAGMRQDVRPGPSRTWVAVGIQGLAPYWFDVGAIAYVGASGRTHVRIEGEYELLLTNRFILQPLAEIEVYGKADPERGFGAGLGRAETGLRLRYEIRRELAPYLGLTWRRAFGGTADLARAAGREVGETRLAAGLRLWF